MPKEEFPPLIPNPDILEAKPEIKRRLEVLFEQYFCKPNQYDWRELALRLAIKHDPLLQPHIPAKFQKTQSNQRDYSHAMIMMKHLIKEKNCSQIAASKEIAEKLKLNAKTLEKEYSKTKHGQGAPDIKFTEAKARNYIFRAAEEAAKELKAKK